MRKIFVIFLSSFFFWSIISLFNPKTVYADCYSLDINPQSPTSSERVTITATVSVPFGPKDYKVEVFDQNYRLLISRQGQTDRYEEGGYWKGKIQEIVGPFAEGGLHRVRVSTRIASDAPFEEECHGEFLVSGAPTPTPLPTPTPTPPPDPLCQKLIEGRCCEKDEDCRIFREGDQCLDYHCVETVGSCPPGSLPAMVKLCQFSPGYTSPTPVPFTGFAPTPCTPAGGLPDSGIPTALGCLPTDIGGFLGEFVLKYVVGIAGVVALFLILLAGFQMMTSQGNPERLQAGRELLTSALLGLLFVIFSVVLMQIIGLEIFKIPGFPTFQK